MSIPLHKDKPSDRSRAAAVRSTRQKLSEQEKRAQMRAEIAATYGPVNPQMRVKFRPVK